MTFIQISESERKLVQPDPHSSALNVNSSRPFTVLPPIEGHFPHAAGSEILVPTTEEDYPR